MTDEKRKIAISAIQKVQTLNSEINIKEVPDERISWNQII